MPAAVDSEAKDLANYTVTLVNGHLRVTKAPLTVTAADKTKVYGAGNPVLTGKMEGLQNGDESPRARHRRRVGSEVGAHAIVAGRGRRGARCWPTTTSSQSTRR